MNYKKRQRMQDHRGNSRSLIASIDDEIMDGLFIRNILRAPNIGTAFEDEDSVCHILRNSNLSMSDRLLIDQRYFQGLSLVKMGKIHGCSRGNIGYKLTKILDRLRYISGAA